MLFCGLWRPERTWLDRLRRFLGTTWVLVGTIYGYETGRDMM
jgi:hypothetical protein